MVGKPYAFHETRISSPERSTLLSRRMFHPSLSILSQSRTTTSVRFRAAQSRHIEIDNHPIALVCTCQHGIAQSKQRQHVTNRVDYLAIG
jgi:hypothetical protein